MEKGLKWKNTLQKKKKKIWQQMRQQVRGSRREGGSQVIPLSLGLVEQMDYWQNMFA